MDETPELRTNPNAEQMMNTRASFSSEEQIKIKPEIIIKREITKNELDKLYRFIKEEIDKFVDVSKNNTTSEIYKRRASATMNHSKYLDALKDFLDGECPKQLVLVLAQEEGKIVGFSYALIHTDTHTQVGNVNTYIGTAWDCQGKGIGTELLRSRSEALLSKGITKYTTSVWDRSRQLYDKLGIKYDTNPENPQEIIVDLTTFNTRERTSETT